MTNILSYPFDETVAVKRATELSGQSEWELKQLLLLVHTELKPKITVELGTFEGGTTYLLDCVTSQLTITIDILPNWNIDLPISKIKIIGGDTHDANIKNSVKELMGGELCDLLFIDANHTYESVKTDFELWSPLVRNGGWIVLHDIDPAHVNSEICQVNKFWNELSGDKMEFICSNEHRELGYGGIPVHYGGIGILKT